MLYEKLIAGVAGFFSEMLFFSEAPCLEISLQDHTEEGGKKQEVEPEAGHLIT